MKILKFWENFQRNWKLENLVQEYFTHPLSEGITLRRLDLRGQILEVLDGKVKNKIKF